MLKIRKLCFDLLCHRVCRRRDDSEASLRHVTVSQQEIGGAAVTRIGESDGVMGYIDKLHSVATFRSGGCFFHVCRDCYTGRIFELSQFHTCDIRYTCLRLKIVSFVESHKTSYISIIVGIACSP